MSKPISYNVPSDGNCGFNAFFVSLYHLVLAQKVNLNASEVFTHFVDGFIKKSEIAGIDEKLPAQDKFIAAMATLKRSHTNTYLQIAQRHAAPLLRKLAASGQKEVEIAQQKNECTVLESCLIDAMAQKILENGVDIADTSAKQSQNDLFDGMDVLDELTKVYVNEFKGTPGYDPNKVYQHKEIADWLCATHKPAIIKTWREQKIDGYFEQLANGSRYVGINTLLPLAQVFGVGFVYRTKDNISHNEAGKAVEQSIQLSFELDKVRHWDPHLPDDNVTRDMLGMKPKQSRFHYVKGLVQKYTFCNDKVASLAKEIIDFVADEKAGYVPPAQEQADYEYAKRLQLEEIEAFAKECQTKSRMGVGG